MHYSEDVTALSRMKFNSPPEETLLGAVIEGKKITFLSSSLSYADRPRILRFCQSVCLIKLGSLGF